MKRKEAEETSRFVQFILDELDRVDGKKAAADQLTAVPDETTQRMMKDGFRQSTQGPCILLRSWDEGEIPPLPPVASTSIPATTEPQRTDFRHAGGSRDSPISL